MTLILKTDMNKRCTAGLISIILIAVIGLPSVVSARSISVTPTILEMFAVPGQVWSSSIKVINQNADPLTVYADTANFAPQGERGHGSFRPVPDAATDNTTLAEWMDVSPDPYIIPPEGSVNVPVSIRVPEDAAPGGHYAAVMIGTRPPDGGSMQVGTAQIISSLFFVRIAGDVVEKGQIRSFRPLSQFVQTPNVDFSLRFENTGNVHLQPQGEIIITNMWGRERGIIPINQKTHFGNVLPQSVREFQFTWSGEPAFTDVGRYEATVALGYGTDQRTFLTKRTHFWVVPVRPLLILLGSLTLIIVFVSWCVRAYVRRMLMLSGVDPNDRSRRPVDINATPFLQRVRMPLQEGVIDLREQVVQSKNRYDRLRAVGNALIKYKVFMLSLFGLVLVGGLLWWYFATVFVPARHYDVTIDNNGQATKLDSEEILYERTTTHTDSPVADVALNESYNIRIINTTATPGRAAAMAENLTVQGYAIAAVSTDVDELRNRTVIIYPPDFANEALQLSEALDGALLSAAPTTTEATGSMPYINIFVGAD